MKIFRAGSWRIWHRVTLCAIASLFSFALHCDLAHAGTIERPRIVVKPSATPRQKLAQPPQINLSKARDVSATPHKEVAQPPADLTKPEFANGPFAEATLRKLAGAGDPWVMTLMSLALTYGDERATKAESINLLKQASEKDFPLAQLLLGNAYLKGDEITKDQDEGERLFKIAAEKRKAIEALAITGDSRSQFEFSIFNLLGCGAPVDMRSGMEWLRKSAESGNALAQMMISQDDRSPPAEIEHWLRKSAEQGFQRAPSCPRESLCKLAFRRGEESKL